MALSEGPDFLLHAHTYVNTWIHENSVTQIGVMMKQVHSIFPPGLHSTSSSVTVGNLHHVSEPE